jgi:predicted lactoylglutathione lyase
MLFLTLPVTDLPTARGFYEALGFPINEHSSDERTAAVVVDDNIVVTLLARDDFAALLGDGAGTPSAGTTVLPRLTVERRAEVDDLLTRVDAAGGRLRSPAREDGTTYTGSFADPDGHVWQVLWMDQLHVVN